MLPSWERRSQSTKGCLSSLRATEGSTRAPCMELCSAREESWPEGNVPGTQAPEISPQVKGPGGIPTC